MRIRLSHILLAGWFAQPGWMVQPSWGQPLESPTSRVLQPGDQLEIHILSLPELEKKYQIRADGTFFHPTAGEVVAAGKSLKEVEGLLRQRLLKQLRKPDFRIGVTSLAESEATALGEVRSPGRLKFAPGTNVMELLGQAGGLTEKADLDGGVLHRNGKQIALNLGPAGQAEMARMQILKGDILVVNRGKRITVTGEVQTKGTHTISSKSLNPLEDCLRAAGGTTENGALNRVQIIRPTFEKPEIVNLLDREASAKVVLEEGDNVFLPPRKVVVLGAVGKPGAVNLEVNDKLMDVVAKAGFSKDSKIDSLMIVRAQDVAQGNAKKEVYNLDSAFTEEKSPIINVAVFDGDLVYVPTKDEKGIMSNPSSLVGLLVLARSIFSF